MGTSSLGIRVNLIVGRQLVKDEERQIVRIGEIHRERARDHRLGQRTHVAH